MIIEFKADSTRASSAVDQITGTGYLYNLSMRTIAQKAVVVSINSQAISGQPSISVAIKDIPNPEGIFNRLMKDFNSDEKQIRQTVEEEDWFNRNFSEKIRFYRC